MKFLIGFFSTYAALSFMNLLIGWIMYDYDWLLTADRFVVFVFICGSIPLCLINYHFWMKLYINYIKKQL